MDYTKSSSYDVHTATGNRMHEDSKAIPTMVTDDDLNGLNWEIVGAIRASGQTPKTFNRDDPASYAQLLGAIKYFAWGSASATSADWYSKSAADERFLKLTDRFLIMPQPSDFNTFVDAVVIYNGGNLNHVNAPFGGLSGILVVLNPRKALGSSQYAVVQTYYTYDGRQAQRAMSSAGVWTTWREVLFVEDLPSKLVYAAANNANVDFPIGTSVLVIDSSYTSRARNALTVLYLSTANNYQFTTASGGTALSGTWACRGGSSAVSVFQRIA